jgi:probable rRNA maturation factor
MAADCPRERGHVVGVAVRGEGVEAALVDAMGVLGRDLLGWVADLPEAADRGAPLELSILLTDDAGIRPLNRDYRGNDGATDVLSFEQEGRLLGDVVISVQTAGSRVDAAAGWTLQDELLFLLIHGTLHLLGHDHEEAAERDAMETAEQALWTALGRMGTLRA